MSKVKKQGGKATAANEDQEQHAKGRIGELLLSLLAGNASEGDWRKFELRLRRYYDWAYHGR